MASNIQLLIMRQAMAFYDSFGRKVFYNKDMPKSGRIFTNIPYGNYPLQKLDVYVPKNPPPSPMVAYVHGGGWFGGDKINYQWLARWLSNQGLITFVMNYRLVPSVTFAAQITDVADALIWILKNAKEYGGDPEQLVLMGESAGAHLVSWYSAAACKPEIAKDMRIKGLLPKKRIKCQVLLYGIYDLISVLKTGFPFIQDTIKGFMGNNEKLFLGRAQMASPIRHVKADYPPTLVMSGEADKLHSQSVEFVDALSKFRVPYEKHFFTKSNNPEAKHAFMNDPKLDCTQRAYKTLDRYLAGHVKRVSTGDIEYNLGA